MVNNDVIINELNKSLDRTYMLVKTYTKDKTQFKAMANECEEGQKHWEEHAKKILEKIKELEK